MELDAFIQMGFAPQLGFGGALSSVRADDLAALPIAELMARHPQVDWSQTDEVIYGDANQAGEDNRNVARMAAFWRIAAGCRDHEPFVRQWYGRRWFAARGIKSGIAESIAGGVESMYAPFVMPAETAFSRNNAVYDTTIGWRFVNPKMDAAYGTDSMPETADNVADDYGSVARIRTPCPALSGTLGGGAGGGRFADELCGSASRSVGGIPLLLIRMNTRAPNNSGKFGKTARHQWRG